MSALDELIENVKIANEGLEPHYTWRNNGTGINLAYNMTTSSVTDPAEDELSALRAEVEKSREIIADANELLWEFTENPNIEMGEVGHSKIAAYFKKYAALNAPSEGQKRD